MKYEHKTGGGRGGEKGRMKLREKAPSTSTRCYGVGSPEVPSRVRVLGGLGPRSRSVQTIAWNGTRIKRTVGHVTWTNFNDLDVEVNMSD